jgi:hypothetical protein
VKLAGLHALSVWQSVHIVLKPSEVCDGDDTPSYFVVATPAAEWQL